MNYKLILKILWSQIKSFIVIFLTLFIAFALMGWEIAFKVVYEHFQNRQVLDYSFMNRWIAPVNIGIYVIIILLAFLIYKLYIRGTKNLPYELKKVNLKLKDFGLILGLLVITFSFSLTLQILFKPAGDHKMYTLVDIYKEVAISLLFAPVYEELLFRGVWFNICLNKKFVTKENEKIITIITIVLSSIIFAFGHSSKFDLELLAHIPAAFMFAYVYYKYKNIKINMGIHFLNNLVSQLVMLLPVLPQIIKAIQAGG